MFADRRSEDHRRGFLDPTFIEALCLIRSVLIAVESITLFEHIIAEKLSIQKLCHKEAARCGERL